MARLREQGIVAVAFGALGLALVYAWVTPAETPEPVAAQAPSAELAERRRCVTEQELASALDAQRIALLAGVRAELDAMQPLAPSTPTLATETDASDAALISRMSDGSLSRAIDLADHSELRSGREVVVDFLRVSFVDDADATEEAVRLLAGQGREQVKLYLQLLLAWIRDLLILRQTGDESTLVNVDQIDAIRSFVAKLPDADVARMVSLIEEGLHLVERNVNATSVLRSLGIGLRDAMKGRPGGNLYQPLARTSSGFVAKSALA